MSQKTLPNGWSTAPIGMLCSLENGRAFRPTEWTSKGIPIVRIQNLNNPNAPFNFFDQEYSDQYHLNGGELLFAWSGTPGTSFGAHIWYGKEAVLNQHIFRVDFDEKSIDKRFFRYAINQKLGELIDVAHGGVGLRHVTKGKFEKTVVVIPPLNEQKRIADKLDAMLARVGACRERLDRVPQILKRFRQSVLVAATSGALTEDWRKAKRMKKRKWPRTRLAEIGELGRGKSKHRPRNDPRLYGGTYPFIQTGDVAQSGGTIHSHTQTYSDFGLAQSKLWPAGTVCITIAANIADTAILSYPACFPDSVVGFVANPVRCLPQFVKWSIDVIRTEIDAIAPATAQKNINLAVLNHLEFELPSLTEQREIIRRVETLFAFADRLETRYTVARTQVENMPPALLAKAFCGELVPQDPNDEPASELLKRIKEQKLNQPEQKRIPRANTIKNERHMNTKTATTLDELVSVLDQLGGDAMADRLVIESGLSEDIDRFFELLREGRDTLLDVPVGSNKPIRRIVDANQ